VKHLKKVLLKSSAPEVMTSQEASSLEVRSPEAEDHQKMKESKLQRLFKGFNHNQHCRRPEE